MQTDSGLTNQELAQRVHASAPTCLRRVRRLVEEGVIEKQVALVNPARIGSSLTAIIEITLDVQTAEAYDAFEVAIAPVREVLQETVYHRARLYRIAQVGGYRPPPYAAHEVFTSQAMCECASFSQSPRAVRDARHFPV